MKATNIKMLFRFPGFKALLVMLFICAPFFGCASQNKTLNRDANHSELADTYYKKKNYSKAKQELMKILDEFPDDVESNYRLGVIYGNEGLNKKSKAAFRKVISIDSAYSKAYYNLGVLYSKSDSDEDIENSIKCFEKYIQLEPDSKHKKKIERWKILHTSKTE